MPSTPTNQVRLLVQEQLRECRLATGDQVIAAARAVLVERINIAPLLSRPEVVRDFLLVTLSPMENEIFMLPMLGAQNRLIKAS